MLEFNTQTYEEIKNKILEDMTSDADKREGSYTNEMVSAVAYQIWIDFAHGFLTSSLRH